HPPADAIVEGEAFDAVAIALLAGQRLQRGRSAPRGEVAEQTLRDGAQLLPLAFAVARVGGDAQVGERFQPTGEFGTHVHEVSPRSTRGPASGRRGGRIPPTSRDPCRRAPPSPCARPGPG